MLNNKKIFITGGAGFIGSSLAERINPSNEIFIYDNLNRNSLQYKQIKLSDKFHFQQGDILDLKLLTDSLKAFQPTHIIHCAAIAGIDTTIKSPTTTLRTNLLGTANLLDATYSLKLSCERILIFSTSEIFGQYAFQSTESHSAVIGAVGEARWTYAVSKLANEHLAMAYHNEHNLPCVIIRPFNVYGPGQIGEGALSIFIQRALQNLPLFIHGDGTQIRAWCFIEDMIESMLKCLVLPEAIGESFNIGNPRAITTIYGLANLVCRILNSKSEIKFSGTKVADVELRIPDVSKSKRILSFSAQVDLEEGIPLTAKYYNKVTHLQAVHQ